jgi:hypothetical protein
MLVPTDIVPGRLLSRHGRIRAHRLMHALGMLFPWLGSKSKTVLDLHQHGIVVRHAAHGKERFIPFMAMADLYLYRTGGRLFGPANALAFRRGSDDAWVDVLDTHGDAFQLRGEIIGGQLRERGPLALRSLEAGAVLTFHAITDADRLARRTAGATTFGAKATSVIALSSAGIHVDGEPIPIADIARLDEGGPDGSLRLLDAQGQVLWRVHYLSLFSADLFIVLMRTMIEAHQYGLLQKNRPPEIRTRAADAGGAGGATGLKDGES